jgi:antitoxin MazE
MKVTRWRKNLAIRLLAALVEALDLREGDDVTLCAAGARTLEVAKSLSANQLLARLRRFRVPKDRLVAEACR